jgi:hypothetical protein
VSDKSTDRWGGLNKRKPYDVEVAAGQPSAPPPPVEPRRAAAPPPPPELDLPLSVEEEHDRVLRNVRQ